MVKKLRNNIDKFTADVVEVVVEADTTSLWSTKKRKINEQNETGYIKN